MPLSWKLVLTTVFLVVACSKKQESAAPGEAFGCNEFVDGALQHCVELSPASPEADRLIFGKDCSTPKLAGKLTGQLVKHCPDGDIAALCTYPSGKLTGRIYKSTSEQAMRGAELGCKARGGTFAKQ